jgi:hypothetical protein
MAINLVQYAFNSIDTGGSAFSPQTKTVSVPFSTSNNSGNTILAICFYRGNWAGWSATSGSVADTQINTYSQLFFNGAGNQSGGAIAAYMATGILAGANTATFSLTFNGGVFSAPTILSIGILVLEYSGMGTPTYQDSGFAQIFGSAGNSIVNLTLTDSHSATVTVTFGGSANGVGPGTDGALAILDLLVSGVDYLIAVSSDVGNPVTATSTYQPLQQELSPRPALGTSAGVIAYWDVGSLATMQPQIFVVT